MPSRTHANPARLRSSPEMGRWWQVAFVFGPLLVLAGVGLWGLRESRVAAKRHAIRAVEGAMPLIEQIARNEEAKLRQETERLFVFGRALPAPAEAGDGALLYEQALAAAPDAARPLLDQLEREHAAAVTASGVPLLPLVKWTRLRLARSVEEMGRTVDELAVTAVRTHPSALSGMLLERTEILLAEAGADLFTIRRWRAVQAEHERGLEVWQAAEHRDPGKMDEWLPRDAPEWFFRVAGGGYMFAFSPEQQRASAERLAAGARALLPLYFALDVGNYATGRSLLSVPPEGERFFPQRGGLFTVTAVLKDPAKLYAQQMRQVVWLGALLLAALLAAAAGFVTLRGSLLRERQLSEMKSNFVSSVSHELRAPLASMRLLAENLESGIVGEAPRQAEYHRLIADECRRLSALVDNVLDFARIEQGRKTYRLAETDIAALVADTLRLLEPVAARRGQKFSVAIEPLVPRCDGLALQQALINLLDNAMKFSPSRSTITVCVSKHEEREWALAVTDEGPGVPSGERDKIFQRFYRVGSELTRETPGAGIGLSIVQHIAEGHGGRVEVAGATFTLVLPLAPVEPAPEAQS